MTFVYLNFSDLKDFIQYLMTRGIHRYGSVIIQQIKSTSEKGLVFHTYTIKLTAKDDIHKEILKYELLFYREVFVDDKDLQEKHEKAVTFIKDSFKEFAKGYSFTVVNQITALAWAAINSINGIRGNQQNDKTKICKT